jgi:hypothetical protein
MYVYVNERTENTVTTLNTVVTGLTAATSYTFTVRAKMQQSSGVSNTLTVTNSNTQQLIYVLGIHRRFFKNKALEISNATNSAVNLYSIKKQSNGAGRGRRITLSGTLSSGSKFTIVNSLMSSSCYATSAANLSTSAEMAFNGNDAVVCSKTNSD